MTERRHRYLLPDRRIDHRISEKNTIFGRWTTNWAHYVTAQNYPSLATTTLRHSHHIVITDTHVFSPTLVNTFRFGFYKEGTWNGGAVSGYQPIRGDEVVRDLGIQGVNAKGLSAMGFPRMNITGYAYPLRFRRPRASRFRGPW